MPIMIFNPVHSAPDPPQNYFLGFNNSTPIDRKWTTKLEKLPGS